MYFKGIVFRFSKTLKSITWSKSWGCNTRRSTTLRRIWKLWDTESSWSWLIRIRFVTDPEEKRRCWLVLFTGWFAYQGSAHQLPPPQLARVAAAKLPRGVHHPHCQSYSQGQVHFFLLNSRVWWVAPRHCRPPFVERQVLQRFFILLSTWYKMMLNGFFQLRFGYLHVKGG